MKKAKIQIVEDEAIIAMEIENSLKNLGYCITSVVDTGEKAIHKANSDRPDIILMDIRIKGPLDGIETADLIRSQFNIPIVFVSAYLDEARIKRAKLTMPFGYILKPIQERDLKVTIEMAMFVAKVDNERRKTETILAKSQEMAKIGSWEWLFDTNDVFWTDEMYRIYGLEKHEKLLLEKVYEMIHPEDKQSYQNIFRDPAKVSVLDTIEYRIISKNNEQKHIRSVAERIYDSSGKLIRMIGTDQDISEQKQAELALKKINERFDLATRAAKLGVWDWNIKSNVLIWDDHMYQLYGVQKKDFAGAYEAWLKGLHPEDVKRCNLESEAARQGIKEYETEFRVIWPDGTIRHIMAYGKVIKDSEGTPLRMLGINYDITEQKLAKEKLQKSEESLKTAQRITKTGNFEWDLRTNEVIWSEGMFEIFGVDKEKYTPSVTSFSHLVHPDDWSILAQNNIKVYSEIEYHELEYRVIDQKTKATKLIHVWGKTTFDTKLSPISIHGIVQDISNFKQVV